MRSTTLDIVFLSVLASVIVYSSMNAWFSDPSGGKNIAPLKREISELKRQIAAADAEIRERNDLIDRLTPPEIDLELFEQHVRANLGVANKNDVLLIPPSEPSR